MLQQHGLARAGRRHDQRPLPLAKRREQIHHASRDRLLAGFEAKPGFGVDGRELIEVLDVDIEVGRHALNLLNLANPRPLLPPARLHEHLERHPLTQPIPLDHRRRHKGIGPLTLIVRFRTPQESIPVGVHLKDAASRFERDRLTIFSDFRFEFRGPHALPFHVDGTSTRRRGAAATTTAATKPPPPAAVAATTTAATVGLSLSLTLSAAAITARCLASLPAKSAPAPRSPPLRHGYNTPKENGSDHNR